MTSYHYFLLPIFAAMLLFMDDSVDIPVLMYCLLFKNMRLHFRYGLGLGLRALCSEVGLVASHATLGHLEIWDPGFLSAVLAWQGLWALISQQSQGANKPYVPKRARSKLWPWVWSQGSRRLQWITGFDANRLPSWLPGGAKVVCFLYRWWQQPRKRNWMQTRGSCSRKAGQPSIKSVNTRRGLMQRSRKTVYYNARQFDRRQEKEDIFYDARQLGSTTIIEDLDLMDEEINGVQLVSNIVAFPSELKARATTKDLGYDTDSFLIAVDNCCSKCITNSMSDFVGEPKKIDKQVRGIGGDVQVTYVGTVRWSIEDDDGMVHSFTIPETYYNRGSPYRLLSPQHRSQVANDNFPKPRGTWCGTYEDAIELLCAL